MTEEMLLKFVGFGNPSVARIFVCGLEEKETKGSNEAVEPCRINYYQKAMEKSELEYYFIDTDDLYRNCEGLKQSDLERSANSNFYRAIQHIYNEVYPSNPINDYSEIGSFRTMLFQGNLFDHPQSSHDNQSDSLNESRIKILKMFFKRYLSGRNEPCLLLVMGFEHGKTKRTLEDIFSVTLEANPGVAQMTFYKAIINNCLIILVKHPSRPINLPPKHQEEIVKMADLAPITRTVS
jgi:hypothetical protein